MKKFRKLYLIIAFLSIIYLVTFMTMRKQYNQISALENRTLAGMPTFSREGLISGDYFSGWDTYLTEQIYGRNYWIAGYTFLNMNILDKKNVNKTVRGQEEYLLPFIPYDRVYHYSVLGENIEKMLANLLDLEDRINDHGGQFLYVGVPAQESFLRDKYPNYFRDADEFVTYNEDLMLEGLDRDGINYINMEKVFRERPDEDYYFKTDHHFNYRGAFRTYGEIINTIRDDLGIDTIREALKEDEMDFIVLDKPILGSRNRQLANIYQTDEKMEIAYPKEEIPYEMTTNGIEDFDFYKINPDPNERPSYLVYMGGDHAETRIQTHREELPNVLMFGDSFTNAIEPLLYYHFNETRILDLRHYNEMTLLEYIDEYKPDVVIMVRDDLNYSNLIGNGKFD